MSRVIVTALLLKNETDVAVTDVIQMPEVMLPLGARGENETTGAAAKGYGKVQVAEVFAPIEIEPRCERLLIRAPEPNPLTEISTSSVVAGTPEIVEAVEL